MEYRRYLPFTVQPHIEGFGPSLVLPTNAGLEIIGFTRTNMLRQDAKTVPLVTRDDREFRISGRRGRLQAPADIDQQDVLQEVPDLSVSETPEMLQPGTWFWTEASRAEIVFGVSQKITFALTQDPGNGNQINNKWIISLSTQNPTGNNGQPTIIDQAFIQEGQPYTVGKQDGNSLVIHNDGAVSDNQLAFVIRERVLYVIDRYSKNGTFIKILPESVK